VSQPATEPAVDKLTFAIGQHNAGLPVRDRGEIAKILVGEGEFAIAGSRRRDGSHGKTGARHGGCSDRSEFLPVRIELRRQCGLQAADRAAAAIGMSICRSRRGRGLARGRWRHRCRLRGSLDLPRRRGIGGMNLRRSVDAEEHDALIHRLGREGVQKQTIHDAVAIIDEAAQKIERL